MNRPYLFRLLIPLAIFTGISRAASAQQYPVNHIYQYSVSMGSGRAYLWIPPDCRQVRGVIMALSNMLERNWLEDPIIRKTAAREGLGIIWVGPAGHHDKADLSADMKPGAGEALENMLKDFAVVSGYKEIADAPIISMGHSAHGQFAWEAANWNPERIIAAIAIKTVPLPDTLHFKNVPLCYMVGQTTEWPEYRDGRPGDRDFFWPVVSQSAIALRNKDPRNLIGVVVDPGGGHFDWSDHLAHFLALYIRKACEYRLPKNVTLKGPARLNKINPESGWLTDTGGMDPDKYSPAPYRQYKGNRGNAYWWFDEATAKAAATFEGDRIPRKKQMLTFIQDGKLLPVAKQGFASLKFEPDEDGLTFHVKGGFLPEMPSELTGARTKLDHANGKIRFWVITGPAVQTGPNTFKIQFDRGGPGPVWIEEEQDGDHEYRHAVQPAQMLIPAVLTKGRAQVITFPEIQNRKAGVRDIPLNAGADSGLPVSYYVAAGPAVVKGNTLRITKVPIRSKYPVKVTVVACQWGRIIPPLYQSAAPVTREFYIEK